MNKAMTINTLFAILQAEIKKGNGSKHILISEDDEGNGYHQLFFGITPSKNVYEEDSPYNPMLPYGVTMEEVLKDYVILG